MTTEELARELVECMFGNVKVKSPTIEKDYLRLATKVQELIIEARIEELERYNWGENLNTPHGEFAQRINELIKQLNELRGVVNNHNSR